MDEQSSKTGMHWHDGMQRGSAWTGDGDSRRRISRIAGRTRPGVRHESGRDYLGFRYDSGIPNSEWSKSARRIDREHGAGCRGWDLIYDVRVFRKCNARQCAARIHGRRPVTEKETFMRRLSTFLVIT